MLAPLSRRGRHPRTAARDAGARVTAGQTSPAPGIANSWRRAITTSGLLPHTIQLCVHCRHNPAGFWVSTSGGQTDAIVERYAPLVWSICRRYRLSGTDADNAGQAVWLHLADQLDTICDPAALPGWLAATTRRECGRLVHTAQPAQPPACVLDAVTIPDEQATAAGDELLAAERHAALREALTQLPPPCQHLIALLIEDPPVPYSQISARLGIPIGSIGPSRRRGLDTLRRHPAIAALINAES